VRSVWASGALALFLAAFARPAVVVFAQQAPPKQEPASKSVWDPLRAEKDIEVGRYYMKKGNYDAAMDRFRDATEARPGYALPYRLLAEAQEKKGLQREAVQSYKTYLKLYPHAEDAGKVRQQIHKLEQELKRKAKRGSN
jgi:Tfp pilus assembly protein PilF